MLYPLSDATKQVLFGADTAPYTFGSVITTLHLKTGNAFQAAFALTTWAFNNAAHRVSRNHFYLTNVSAQYAKATSKLAEAGVIGVASALALFGIVFAVVKYTQINRIKEIEKEKPALSTKNTDENDKDILTVSGSTSSFVPEYLKNKFILNFSITQESIKLDNLKKTFSPHIVSYLNQVFNIKYNCKTNAFSVISLTPQEIQHLKRLEWEKYLAYFIQQKEAQKQKEALNKLALENESATTSQVQEPILNPQTHVNNNNSETTKQVQPKSYITLQEAVNVFFSFLEVVASQI